MLYITIAGVQFVICCDDLSIEKNIKPAYRTFFSMNEAGHYSAPIKIRLESGKLPDLTTLPLLFEYEHGYTVYRCGETYYSAFYDRHYRKVRCIAQATNTFQNITLYITHDTLNALADDRHMLLTFICTQLSRSILMHYFAQREGAAFHAAALNLNGGGYLFPGKSGTGKSTLMRQFALRKTGKQLGDEQIVVRKLEGQLHVFGTPWPGESWLIVNASAPLKGIFFIVQDASNFLQPILCQEALNRLIPTVSIPWYDRTAIPPMLSFCDELLRTVPVYELHCTPTVDVVDVVERHVAQL